MNKGLKITIVGLLVLAVMAIYYGKNVYFNKDSISKNISQNDERKEIDKDSKENNSDVINEEEKLDNEQGNELNKNNDGEQKEDMLPALMEFSTNT